MNSIIKSAANLKHPGFIVFEGLDFTGKTHLAKNAAKVLKTHQHFKLDVKYNHNHGFLNKNLVDEIFLKNLTNEKRVDYLIERYSKDFLSSNPKEFTEIFQDRYFPYLIFHAVTKCNERIENIIPRIDEIIKPKHIFLIECDYEKRKMRALQKSYTKIEELSSITSNKVSTNLTKLYREIVNALGIPSTVIDTTNEKELFDNFFEKLKILNLMSYNVNLDDLVVDHEASIFESTAKFKLNEVLNGKKFTPISLVRKIDNNLNYVDIIRDGRHRAYAAWKARNITHPAYISYESVSNIDESSLKRLKDFHFREGDNGLSNNILQKIII